MNKQRKTSNILNVFQYDEITGAVTLPSTLVVTAPAAQDNSTKVPTTQWVQNYVGNIGYQLAFNVTTNGSSGAATFTNNTLNIPVYSLSGLGGEPAITAGTASQYWRGDKTFQTLNTTAVVEGTNLYFTNARSRAAISVTGSGSYDSATGVITVTGGVTSVNTLTGAVTLTTTNIGEGTNLYYTTARVNSDFDTRLATKSTTNLAEGTNLYYTDARVGTYLTNNSYATQSYVSTQINNLVSGAPGLLDTLDELAAALGDDPNFATTVSTALSNRLRIDINTQGLTSTQQGNGRTNLGLGSLAVLSSVGNAQITDVAWSKVTGAPAFLTAEADTLASVTSRGSSTTGGITINGTATISTDISMTRSDTTPALVFTNQNGLRWTYSGGGNYWSTTLSIDSNNLINMAGSPLATRSWVTSQGYITGNQTITLSGDVTGSGTTSIAVTLANSGVTAGTYTKVTVDAKGRVTSGTTLSAGDIPSLSYLPLSGGTVSGTLEVTGNFSINTNRFTVAAITGNTVAAGTFTANSIIKSGGTSSQFLKADGSVDSNSYVTGGPYLPLAGGTVTGAVTITTSTDGALTLRVPSGDANQWNYINFNGTDNVRDAYFGTDGSGNPQWWRDDNNLNITLGSNVNIGGGGVTLTAADADVRTNRGRFQVYNNAGTGNLGYRIRTDDNGGWRWQFVDGGNTEYFGVAYSTGVVTFGVSSGTIASRGGFSDFIGYNASYGSYIGGGVANASNYLYAGGYFYDGSTVRTLWHTGNLTNLNQLTNGPGYITATNSDLSYNASLTLSTTWQNTGVSSANLGTNGVYIVTCFANDYNVSGSQYSCTYAGVMYWYAGGTNSVDTISEIPLHHSGHHDGGRFIYLRTLSTLGAGDGKTYLQIKGNGTNSGASTYTLTFKRIL